MADEQTNQSTDELIDVSEFDHELSEEALTEIATPDGEEVTPIKKSRKPVKKKVKNKKRGPRKLPKTEKGSYIATIRERFAAFFIDTLLLFYLYWLYVPVYSRIFLGKWKVLPPGSGWHLLAFHGSFLFICFLYYFILEGIFLTTIGKFVCWMSVRRKDSEPASLLSIFIRNLIRPIDYLLFIPNAFLMELTSFRQRIGDTLAGTTVIKKYGIRKEPYKITEEFISSASGRTVAILIDTVLFLFFAVGYLLILDTTGALVNLWIILAAPLAYLVYFVTIEMITETSPGKCLMGYVICQDDGGRLRASGSLMRNIWRIFDLNPIGFLCIFTSSKKRRPGDVAGGTLVVKSTRTIKGMIGLLVAIAIALAGSFMIYSKESFFMNKENILRTIPKIPGLSIIRPRPKFENIKIQHFRFAANTPNDVRTPPTFSPGETIYLVFEIQGYKKVGRKVWIQEDISVEYPDGSIGLKQNNIVDYREVMKGYGPIELNNNIELPDNAEPGEYRVTITLRDMFAHRLIVEDKLFRVKENSEEKK